MLKFLITAASSNSGKTAVTCGLLSLLKRQGFDPCAFKCGPDYIDPMFHRSVLGIASDNLDVFLAGEDGVRNVFARGCQGHDAAVCEGVMGYYDGITGQMKDSATSGSEVFPRASAWHVANLLEIPAILVVRPKGAALTLAAVIKGVASFRHPSRICGVIFNDCSEMYYRMYAPLIEAESGIPVLGYVPHMEEAAFESRHLGLMTAEEIQDLSQRIERIGARMAETIDMQSLVRTVSDSAGLETAGAEASPADGTETAGTSIASGLTEKKQREDSRLSETFSRFGSNREVTPVRIAVARDAAFNFIYAESIAAMERAGAVIEYFSPLQDQALPEDVHGLYLPGGYPELYGKQLAENESMRAAIRRAVKQGLPTIAECGGFLYLGESLADAEGQTWPMAGALPGHAAGTGRLVRFGYGTIGCGEASMLFRPGEAIPVHEFHYWDTTATGDDLTLTKHSNGKQWNFGYAGETLYAGFPHLYLGGPAAKTGEAEAECKEESSAAENQSGSVKEKRNGTAAETLADRFVEAARQHAAEELCKAGGTEV